MVNAYTGPEYDEATCRAALEDAGVRYRKVSDAPDEAARLVSEGRIVGWFQGRVEFGPRALGNRSILADPRRAEMKDVLNKRIKHREPFRPFAPSVLLEHTAEVFEESRPSPFMLLTYAFRKEWCDRVPAVAHVDGTGRLQTVTPHENPRYWDLIESFRRRTGVPLVLNTSFNENEPIVCTPRDAVRCFVETKMDALFLGDFLAERSPAA
jgi:carbamoyltransferase